MRKVINLIVTCGLMAIALYVITYIPQVIDFTNVIVRLEDNDTIYRFLLYLPLILCIFNSMLQLINIFTDNVTVSIMGALISIGITIFIGLNVMGFVTALPKTDLESKLHLVQYVNIGATALLILNSATYFIKKKSIQTKEG